MLFPTGKANDHDFCIQTALLWIRSQETHIKTVGVGEDENTGISIILEQKSDGIATVNEANLKLLHLHRDRLATAADQFGWRIPAYLEKNEAALSSILEKINEHTDQLPKLLPHHLEHRKLRILISKEGTMSIDSLPIEVIIPKLASQTLSGLYIPQSFDEPFSLHKEPCKVYLDRQPSNSSSWTTYKTTYRVVYDSARSRTMIPSKCPPTTAEVLLYNYDNEIFDASSCTVYFNRAGHWVTPSASSGSTLGVTRRLALESGLCKEGSIDRKDLMLNESIWLSNAVRGFFRGVLVLEAKHDLDGSVNVGSG